MRMLGATLTRYFGVQPHAKKDCWTEVTDEQLAVSCIAGVVTFKLEDGTTIEVDEVALNGVLFFAAHGDVA